MRKEHRTTMSSMVEVLGVLFEVQCRNACLPINVQPMVSVTSPSVGIGLLIPWLDGWAGS
jgi:hypothetical protein